MKLYSTRLLAIVLAAATAAAPSVASAAPLSGVSNLHPHNADSRIHVALYNQSFVHHQVRIAGKLYAIEPLRTLIVTVPAGTQIYAASEMHSYKNGSLLIEVTPQDESHKLVLN